MPRRIPQPDCPDCECPQVRIDDTWIACPEGCGWSEVWADTPDGMPVQMDDEPDFDNMTDDEMIAFFDEQEAADRIRWEGADELSDE